MSIAELIMTGTERASKSTDWVADSLAKIGQNVGKVLADREQQKQAQEMLPMFQKSMQDAMTYANEGDSGLAFSKLMPFLTNPATLKNPYILPALDAGTKMIELAANDYARNIQVEAYRDRYSGGGGGGGLGSQEDIISAFTQGAPGYTDAEMAAQDVTDQVGETTAAVSPRALYQRDIARRSAGLPATQGAGGFPFEKIKEEARQRDGSQEPNMEAIPVEPLLPGEQPATRPQGPVNPTKNEPSPDTIKAFKRYSENFLDLPLRGQKEDRDKASIIFRDKENIDKYVQSKQGEGQFIEVASQSSVAVPGVFGVELPKEISKFVIAGGSLGKNGFTYRIDERQEGSQKAKDAVDWLNEWQQTAVKAESNTDIRNLLNQAGNDALNIEVSEKPTSEDDDQISYNVQVRGNPQTAIQVTRDVYNDILELKLQTAAARTHGAKFLRMKQSKPTAEAPAPTQGGLPATQPPPAAAIPDAKGNPFAEKIKKIQTTETESNKKAVKEEIDFVVKTASRLSEALTGLSKGEYPKTLDYLPRAKQEALKGSSLENLRTEYNTLANLKEAIDYIKNNPNTPEAAQAVKVIKQKLGI